MNEMLIGCKDKIKSASELGNKIAKIKARQLLGIEFIPSIYMLAILNMIMMGDGAKSRRNHKGSHRQR